MGRFLVSSLAGMLAVVGGWFGWLRADAVDAVDTDADRSLAPDGAPSQDGTSRERTPSDLPSDPDATISPTDSPAGEPRSLPRPASTGGMNRRMDRLDDEPRVLGGTAGWSLRVARTDPDDLGAMDRWEYWDRPRWAAETRGATSNESAQLIPADHGFYSTNPALYRPEFDDSTLP